MYLGPLGPVQLQDYKSNFERNASRAQRVRRALVECEYCRSTVNTLKRQSCQNCGAPVRVER